MMLKRESAPLDGYCGAVLSAPHPPVLGTLSGSGVAPNPVGELSPCRGPWTHQEELQSMNRSGCARCHTAQGYHQVILSGGESTAPYSDPTGLDLPGLPQSWRYWRLHGRPLGRLREGCLPGLP